VENSAPAAPAGSDLPADFPFERSRSRVKFLKQYRKHTKGPPQKNVYTQVLRHAATTDTCERVSTSGLPADLSSILATRGVHGNCCKIICRQSCRWRRQWS